MSVTFETPTLETERLILRAPKASDLDVYATFFTKERSQYVGGPRDAEDAWEIFCMKIGHWVSHGFGHYTITLKGNEQPIGQAGFLDKPWEDDKELGWLLFDAKHEGQGFAFEAAKACIDHAWGVLKLDTFVSYIDPRNTPSVKLAERLGAVLDPKAKFANPLTTWGLTYRHPKPELAA